MLFNFKTYSNHVIFIHKLLIEHHFVPQIKLGADFYQKGSLSYVSANEQHDSTPLNSKIRRTWVEPQK